MLGRQLTAWDMEQVEKAADILIHFLYYKKRAQDKMFSPGTKVMLEA